MGRFRACTGSARQQGCRVLEGEQTDPRTGRTLRVFDTRSFDRVRQLQHSITEVESVGPDGTVELLQRSEFDMRWVYKEEMASCCHTGYTAGKSAVISRPSADPGN